MFKLLRGKKQKAKVYSTIEKSIKAECKKFRNHIISVCDNKTCKDYIDQHATYCTPCHKWLVGA